MSNQVNDDDNNNKGSKGKFLQELESADPKGGVFLFRDFLSSDDATSAFECFNNDANFPWDKNPKLYGVKLTQHAYIYNRKKSKNKAETFKGIAVLEELCEKVQQRFDGKVTDVYCNRFNDSTHRIDWHTDTYGTHIFVLSLGSERNVEFKEKQGWKIKPQVEMINTVRPSAGDIYFMPLQLNKTHVHRVCAADGPVTTPRISFVFFFETPKYATEYKITTGDQLRGLAESLFTWLLDQIRKPIQMARHL